MLTQIIVVCLLYLDLPLNSSVVRLHGTDFLANHEWLLTYPLAF